MPSSSGTTSRRRTVLVCLRTSPPAALLLGLALCLCACGKRNALGEMLCKKVARCSGAISKGWCTSQVSDALEDRRVAASQLGACADCIVKNECSEILRERDCDFACADVPAATTAYTVERARRELCHRVHGACGHFGQADTDSKPNCPDETSGKHELLSALVNECAEQLKDAVFKTPDLDVVVANCHKCIDPIAALPSGEEEEEEEEADAGTQDAGPPDQADAGTSGMKECSLDEATNAHERAAASAYQCRETVLSCRTVCGLVEPIRLRMDYASAVRSVCESDLGACFQTAAENSCVADLWARFCQLAPDPSNGAPAPAREEVTGSLQLCAQCLAPEAAASGAASVLDEVASAQAAGNEAIAPDPAPSGAADVTQPQTVTEPPQDDFQRCVSAQERCAGACSGVHVIAERFAEIQGISESCATGAVELPCESTTPTCELHEMYFR